MPNQPEDASSQNNSGENTVAPNKRTRLEDFPALRDASLLDANALPESVLELDDFKDHLEDAMAACEAAVKALMAEEDYARGIFRAAEIHEAKQMLMMLRYQRDLCVVRINQKKGLR